MEMELWVVWVRSTELHAFVHRYEPWLWPLMQTLHLFGFTLLIGTVGFFDLRALGMAKGIPLQAIHRLIPWGVAGYIGNILLGVVFFSGHPEQYYYNDAFRLKLLFMMVAGINLAMLWVVRRLVDLVLVARNPSALTMVVLELGLLFLVQGLFAMGHSYLTATIGQHVVTDLRIQLFAHLETLSLGFFSRRRTGELMSRLMNDVSALQHVLTDAPIDSAKQVVTLVAAHADDLVHPVAGQEQRVAGGVVVAAHERMFDALGVLGAAPRADIGAEARFEQVEVILADVMADSQLPQHRPHRR